MAQFITFKVFGQTAFLNCDGLCNNPQIRYGYNGKGGIASINSISSANYSIDETLYISDKVISNGKDGGAADNNGTGDYTSSGSGVKTDGYYSTKTSFTDYDTGIPYCDVRNFYPNGLFGDPPYCETMTLDGSAFIINSQGGGNFVVPIGYGSGGGAAPPNWEINGTNQAPNIRTGRSGFCEYFEII